MNPVQICEACVVAVVSARTTGGVVECVCGVRHGADADRSQRRARAVASPVAPLPRPRPSPALRDRPERVWRGSDEHVPRAVSPLARAGAVATAITKPDDPELVRVRRLLADLRPDCADPWEPPVEAPPTIPHIAIRDPSAAWGGTPRGLDAAMGGLLDRAAEMQARCVADVLAEVDALPAPAPGVLRWVRNHATLKDGLRGLFVDAGIWAGAGGDDLGAQRDAAYALGRRVLLGAARAWGR